VHRRNRHGEEPEALDAARLYGEMWSAERVARLFGYGEARMRRILRGHRPRWRRAHDCGRLR
jgi:hypothetical protein